MVRELIKISPSLLQSGKPFAREIFLRMPKNRKMLRIVLRGDEIRAELVARLIADPTSEIYAQPLEGDPELPSSFPLYAEVFTPTEQSSGAVPLGETLPRFAADPEGGALPARSSEEPLADPDTSIARSEFAPDSATVAPLAENAEESVSISPFEELPEAASTFGAGEGENDTSRLIQSGSALPAESRRSRTESAAEDNSIFGTEGMEDEPTRRIQSESDQTQESHRSRQPLEAEEQAAFAATAELDATTNVSAIDAETGEDARQIDQDEDSPLSIMQATAELSQSIEEAGVTSRQKREEQTRLGAFLDTVAEGFATFSADPSPEETLARAALLPALTEALAEISRQEANGSEVPEVLRGLRDSLGRVTEAITGDAPITAGPDLPTLSNHLSGFVKEYTTAVEGLPSRDDSVLEAEVIKAAAEFARFSADPASSLDAALAVRKQLESCLEKVDAHISEDDATAPNFLVVKRSFEAALKDLPKTSLGAKAYRDTPQIAARMAALLAHSLGYLSPSYLYDLAFSAQLFFTEKNGNRLFPEIVPEIAKAAKSPEEAAAFSGSPLGDSLVILRFLDHYFDNPDCDRTSAEFQKATFEATMRELEGGDHSPEPWTAVRWRSFIEKGPTLGALSLCAKASAKAQKSMRALSNVEKQTDA
jgi:hypothetical protein